MTKNPLTPDNERELARLFQSRPLTLDMLARGWYNYRLMQFGDGPADMDRAECWLDFIPQDDASQEKFARLVAENNDVGASAIKVILESDAL